MVSMIPGMEMLRFTNTGTEATMHALRVARGYTRREKFIRFEGQYHGAHDYVLFSTASSPLSAMGSRNSPIPVQVGSGIPNKIRDYVFSVPFNDFEAVEKVVKDHHGDIAAMMIEPCLGNIAGLEPNEGYLVHLRKLCDKYGIVMIFDEVKTGFRLANGGAREEYNVIPDISTYAKSLGNGFPVAAFGGNKDIMSVGDLKSKWKSFGWQVVEVDGHDIDELYNAFTATYRPKKPVVIIAHTIKGKGIKPFENDPAWHARKIKGSELEIGKKELGLI